ncbi:MAG: hypothetical protein ACI8TQ_004096 [Planctomycetota bacterium]|jgi:hypothetical protein
MVKNQDPTAAICKLAASLDDVTVGSSCNQSSFKVGKHSLLFIGPGAKGVGFKAMFKLDKSMSQAEKLAAKEPDRYQAGSKGWVTVRFTAEMPIPKTIWEKWVKESYALKF